MYIVTHFRCTLSHILHVHCPTFYMYIVPHFTCTLSHILHVHCHTFYMYIVTHFICTLSHILYVHCHTFYMYIVTHFICTLSHILHVHCHTFYMYIVTHFTCTLSHILYVHCHTFYMYIVTHFICTLSHILHVHCHTFYMYIVTHFICTLSHILHNIYNMLIHNMLTRKRPKFRFGVRLILAGSVRQKFCRTFCHSISCSFTIYGYKADRLCNSLQQIVFSVTAKFHNTVIIAKAREVRENIKRNRLIWRIIQLWYFHHYYIVISHNTI